MTKTSDNGIFYMVVEEVNKRYIDVCSGQLIVTCVVGKTEISIHKETFNTCTSKYYIYSHPVTIIFLYTSFILYPY